MIKVKGITKVKKSELEKVCAGSCSYSGGGLSIECDSYQVHVHLEAVGGTIHADELHIHF